MSLRALSGGCFLGFFLEPRELTRPGSSQLHILHVRPKPPYARHVDLSPRRQLKSRFSCKHATRNLQLSGPSCPLLLVRSVTFPGVIRNWWFGASAMVSSLSGTTL